MVGGTDGEVRSLAMDKGGEIVSQFKAHDGEAVSALLVNQENSMLYTAGGDGIIKSWQWVPNLLY